MILDLGQQGQRSLRVPAAIFVGLIVFVSALLCGVIAFMSLYVPVNHLAREKLIDFTKATADVTVDKVQRRFDVFRSQALLAQKILAETPAFISLDSANSSAPTLIPLEDTLLWFARSVDSSSLILVLFHGLNNGIIVSPYSIFDPVNFPRLPGRITVSNLSQASWTSYIDNAYYRLDTFQPFNTTAPFVRNFSNRFNIGIRPYTHVFQQAGYTLTWSPIFIGTTYRATRTSSIGLGSSWGTSGQASNVSARSTIGFHGYIKDVMSFFKKLTIAKTGVAFLVDVSSRAFVGGNIADESLRFVPTVVNGSASPTLTTPQLMLLEQLQDPRVVDVIRAASSTSQNVSQNMLLTCSSDHTGDEGDPSCLLVYDHARKRMSRMQDSSFSLIENVVSLVHVSEVRDAFGLNMRLVIIVPGDDFVGGMRDGVIESLSAASFAIAALMVLVVAVTQLWLLRPFGEMARVLAMMVDGVHEDDSFAAPNANDNGPDEVQRTEPPPHGNDYEIGYLAVHSGSSSDQSPISPSSPSLVMVHSYHNYDTTNGVDYNLTSPTVTRRQNPPQLFHHHHHHRFLRMEVESIATNGVRELTTIKGGLLKLISALEIVRLFLPNTTSGYELVDEEVVTTPVTMGGGSLSDWSSDNPQVLAAGGKRDLATPTKTVSLHGNIIVTTIAANFVKLERLREHVEHSPATVVEIHTEYLKMVLDSCRAHGGTVDLCYGDRVWAHFNAKKRLPRHALKACRALLAIEDAIQQRLSCRTNTILQNEAMQIRIRLGAATTEALCGVMGSSEVKRFTVVGPCVRKATFLSSCAADRRLPLRGRRDNDVPATLNTTMPPVDIEKKASDVFPFSSLVSDKTVELASIRTRATAHVPISVPPSSLSPVGHNKSRSVNNNNNTHFASILFRHVRVSALPQGRRTAESGIAVRVVISTPVFLHRILEEYPEHIIAPGSDAATAAVHRLRAVNEVYELLAAGDESNALVQKMSALPFLEDEWLLRQLQLEGLQL